MDFVASRVGLLISPMENLPLRLTRKSFENLAFSPVSQGVWKPQKKIMTFESSLTNVPTFDEDLVRAFCKLLYLRRFCVSRDQWRKTLSKDITSYL